MVLNHIWTVSNLAGRMDDLGKGELTLFFLTSLSHDDKVLNCDVIHSENVYERSHWRNTFITIFYRN